MARVTPTRQRPSGLFYRRVLDLSARTIMPTQASGTLDVSSFTDSGFVVAAHPNDLDRREYFADRDVYLQITSGGNADVVYTLTGTYKVDGTERTKYVQVTGNVDGAITQLTSFHTGTAVDENGDPLPRDAGPHYFDQITRLQSDGVTGADVQLIAGKALTYNASALYLSTAGDVTLASQADPHAVQKDQPEDHHIEEAGLTAGRWHHDVHPREISASTGGVTLIGY